MLKAVKEQLKRLAEDNDKSFHLSLRDKVGKRATHILEKRLKQMIVLMPDLVERIYFCWKESRNDSQTKKLGAYLLTYLYLPMDFLPDQRGLLGYLDDAYFVARVYSMVIQDARLAAGKIKPSDIALCDQLKMLEKDARIVIPNECRLIDQMIQDLCEDKKKSFFELIEKSDRGA